MDFQVIKIQKKIEQWEYQAAFGVKKFWKNYLLKKRIIQFNPDWIWHLGNYGFYNSPCPQSILVHDSHLVYPEKTYSYESFIYRVKKRVVKYKLKKSLVNINYLYAQTKIMKNRLSAEFNLPFEKIRLCPQSVSYSLMPNHPCEPLEQLNKIKNKFILIVLSKFYGHKNFQGILELYKKYRENLKDTICVWTVDSKQHPMAPKILHQIKICGLQDQIINVGPLEQEQLNRLYCNSHALFLPTYLESFSGTYLEAMHYGVPIITSDLDFAHCICGDAACYIDPNDIDSMYKGIRNLIENPEYYKKLVNNGALQKCKYDKTWEEIVCSVLDEENIEHNCNKIN